MERGEQEPRKAAEQGDAGPSDPEVIQIHVPQQQEQPLTASPVREEGPSAPRPIYIVPQQQSQPYITTSPAPEGEAAGPPAPPKTGRESLGLNTRRMSTTPGRYPLDEPGAASVSGQGSPPRVGVSPYPPQRTRTRSRDNGAGYRSGEGLISPSRRPGHMSGLDWIVPDTEALTPRPRTVGERLQPTLDQANAEKTKYERKAFINGYLLNAAIGLQVILGALVTGLSAAVKPTRVGVTTSALGGLSTLVASYLARMRGSNEPELSITRTKDLEQFIRQCNAFQMDRGHITGNEEDDTLNELRRKFEELLGNASGERKLSPPA